MGYLIGIDEAGYAPNLGPLVIAATLWRVPGSPRRAIDLYERLSGIICRESPKKSRDSVDQGQMPKLAIADSKQLYNPQAGLRLLELGVLSLLRASGVRPRDWRGIWKLIAPQIGDQLDGLPWHLDFNPRLPLAADRGEIKLQEAALRAGFREARVRLLSTRATVLFPATFNALVERFGSKGAALSQQSIELLAKMLQPCRDRPILAIGDKHGGRNFYGRFLQEQFADHLVEVYGEGGALSIYRFGPSNRRVEVRFQVRGEEILPVALASMVAKYCRELSMRAFNQFWCDRVPDLRATAGYPGDALRFKRAIEPVQTALGIDDHHLWRRR